MYEGTGSNISVYDTWQGPADLFSTASVKPMLGDVEVSAIPNPTGALSRWCFGLCLNKPSSISTIIPGPPPPQHYDNVVLWNKLLDETWNSGAFRKVSFSIAFFTHVCEARRDNGKKCFFRGTCDKSNINIYKLPVRIELYEFLPVLCEQILHIHAFPSDRDLRLLIRDHINFRSTCIAKQNPC